MLCSSVCLSQFVFCPGVGCSGGVCSGVCSDCDYWVEGGSNYYVTLYESRPSMLGPLSIILLFYYLDLNCHSPPVASRITKHEHGPARRNMIMGNAAACRLVILLPVGFGKAEPAQTAVGMIACRQILIWYTRSRL